MTAYDNCFRGNFFRPSDNRGRPPQSSVQKGVDGELGRIKAAQRGEISLANPLGGLGSSGCIFSSSALRKTHRPKKNH